MILTVVTGPRTSRGMLNFAKPALKTPKNQVIHRSKGIVEVWEQGTSVNENGNAEMQRTMKRPALECHKRNES